MKELTDITGRRPVTDAELAFAKQGIIQGFPGRFETTFGVAGQIAVLVDDDLPDDEFTHYQERVEAVTKADVDRVAREYITPASMSILIVGDRSQIEGPLKSLPFVQAIQRLDTEGNALATAGRRGAVTPARPAQLSLESVWRESSLGRGRRSARETRPPIRHRRPTTRMQRRQDQTMTRSRRSRWAASSSVSSRLQKQKRT